MLIADPDPSFKLFTNSAPGSLLSVWPMGPPQKHDNEIIAANDWLNMTVAQAPNPDTYIYPAPQWGNTIMVWDGVHLVPVKKAINRNGELWQVRTTGLGDRVPTDSTDPWSRYYFKFTRPTMMVNTGRAIHAWRLSLAEDGLRTSFDGVSNVGMVSKRSMKSKIESDHGVTSGTNVFSDVFGRFQSQGVQAGDSLRLNSRLWSCLNVKFQISAVTSQTSLTVGPYVWGNVDVLARRPNAEEIDAVRKYVPKMGAMFV